MFEASTVDVKALAFLQRSGWLKARALFVCAIAATQAIV
jgi:hypothetical protein